MNTPNTNTLATGTTRTPGATPQEEAPARSVLHPQETVEAGQIRAGVVTAALGLTQASMFEGEIRLAIADAVRTAAAVYQLVYARNSMSRIMATAARDAGVADAYDEIANRPRK